MSTAPDAAQILNDLSSFSRATIAEPFTRLCEACGKGPHAVDLHVHVLSIVRDVLVRSPQHARDFYTMITHQADAAICVYDSAGIATGISERYAEILGYGQGELVGRPVFDFAVIDPVTLRRRLHSLDEGAQLSSTLPLRHREGHLVPFRSFARRLEAVRPLYIVYGYPTANPPRHQRGNPRPASRRAGAACEQSRTGRAASSRDLVRGQPFRAVSAAYREQAWQAA